MTALRAVNISKVFEDGFKALSNVDLSVGRGEFVTLLGPSGCGKTTLLKTFAGFHAPTTGHIEINGEDVTGSPPEKRDTAMCFQSYALFPHLSVADNIDFGPRQTGVPRPERLERLEGLLRQVDLEIHRTKLPNKLSGGQQQRVALARALAMRPSIVLFDEPLSNLDAKLREQVRREIRALQRELDFTAIYVTHDQVEALAMSDRVVVMRDGQIDQVGPPEEVYARPATAFVADFIGAANLVAVGEGNGVAVNTAIGALNVSEGRAPGAHFLCWRPEDARVGDVGADAPNVLSGQVVERAFQGSFTELHVRLGENVDQRLHVHDDVARVGDQITFSLPPERLRFVTGDPQ